MVRAEDSGVAFAEGVYLRSHEVVTVGYHRHHEDWTTVWVDHGKGSELITTIVRLRAT